MNKKQGDPEKRTHRDVILMIGPLPPQVGGIEAFIGYLLETDLSKNYAIKTLDMSKPAIQREKMAYATLMGYERSFGRGFWLTLRSWGYSVLFFMRFLYQLVRYRIRILHIHTASHTNFWEKCIYIAVGKLLRKKVIMHVHGSQFELFYHQSRSLTRRLIAYFLGLCNRVIALSQSWFDFFIQFLPAETVSVVRNGIDLRAYQQNDFRKSPEPSVVFLGEVGTRKGIFDLIESAWLLKNTGECPKFHIIGPGAILAAQERAIDKGVGDYFNFYGSLRGKEKIGLMASAWCFILPTYAEGLPLSILEAYAVGLPVISTYVGGIPEVVKHGVNGFLVQPGDARTSAEMLRTVLKDSEMRQKMAQVNRRQAFEKYDINNCARQIDEIYRKLLSD
ncbi:MAG TPA: glycosyltransferase family 4 protein [bacterium]|nr:glycosyltransferase family 4 protein [bacterium]HNT65228.1 glycosyltransferase family 4 protein [bacterium]